jgi:hypothetical protein
MHDMTVTFQIYAVKRIFCMAPKSVIKVSEREFMAQIMQLAQLYKWKVYHTHDSRRSQAGWPDLALLRGNRLICAELKSAKGRLTLEQKVWLEALGNVPGVEVYCWRPDDWEEIVEVLKPSTVVHLENSVGKLV